MVYREVATASMVPVAQGPSSHPPSTLSHVQDQGQVEVTRTVEYYDRFADAYAARFAAVDLAEDRKRFQSSLPARGRVLDAGCAAGRDCALFAREGFLPFGIDLSAKFVMATREHVTPRVARADVQRLPFQTGAFDGVWCCAVLVHLPPAGARRALNEIGRVTRRGGPLFVTTRFGTGSEWRSGPEDGVRWFQLYSLSEIEEIVCDAGFDIQSARCEAGAVSGQWVSVHATRRSS